MLIGAMALVHGAVQPQQPPPQQPPPPAPASIVSVEVTPAPDSDTVDSSFTESLCPCGHGVESFASLIGRDASKVVSQVRQR